MGNILRRGDFELIFAVDDENEGLSGGAVAGIAAVSAGVLKATEEMFEAAKVAAAAGDAIDEASQRMGVSAETFQELQNEQKGTLLVISHQERLLEIADQIAVIVEGRVRIAGPGKEIMPQLMAGEKYGTCPVEAMGKEML